jgi:hypothetical protein
VVGCDKREEPDEQGKALDQRRTSQMLTQ